MLSPTILLAGPATLATIWVRVWAADSQQRARRNAMIAATACAQRRAERLEVEDFLARRTGHDVAGDGVTAAQDTSHHRTGQA